MLPTEHHHGGASGGASAGVDLLPFGVQVAWFAITLALTGLHLAELVGARRGSRVRPATHLAMAAGMAYMYLPGDAHPVPWTAIAVASAVGAVAAAGAAARSAFGSRAFDAPGLRGESAPVRPRQMARWDRALLVDAAELAAMAYMFHAVGPAQSALFYALAVVYVFASINAARTALGVLPRVTGVLMPVAMAYMFLAMNPHGGHFVDRARSVGTEQWWWALAIGLLLLRAAADPSLWRNPEPARPLPR